MPSIKLELFKSKKLSDGRHPVCIRVTHKGKPKRKAVASAFPNEWDSKECRIIYRKDRHKVNRDISDDFDRYEAVFKELSRSGDDWNAEDVFRTEPKGRNKTLKEIFKEYSNAKAAASGWTSLTADSILGKFLNYVSVSYPEQITSQLMLDYVEYLRSVRENKDSTINTNIKYIRMAVSWASSKGICDKPDGLYSFKLPPRGRGVKVKLSDDEVASMELVNIDTGSRTEEALAVWMIAYYLRGMRISDVLQIKEADISGDRYSYVSGKNKKHFNIKMPPEVLPIIKKYSTGKEYLFSFFTWAPKPSLSLAENNKAKASALKLATSHVNNRLGDIARRAGIAKKVSSHSARHYFAKKALDMIRRMNFENATNVSMGLLGHSDLKEHELYVKEILSDEVLDDAADNVFKKRTI